MSVTSELVRDIRENLSQASSSQKDEVRVMEAMLNDKDYKVGEYTKEIFHKLREREYNPELMRLYVVGGGSCILKNFGSYDKDRVIINDDICATAKGYELLAEQKQSRKGGIV